MKKLLLSSILLTSVYASSQDAKITLHNETNDISGTSIIVNTTVSDEQVVEFLIQNNTNEEKTWKITRKRISVPNSNWEDYMCWGKENEAGACYTNSQMSTNTWTSPDAAILSSGSKGLLSVHITPDENSSGNSVYRYFVGTSKDDIVDSVDVEVRTTVLNVKEVKVSSSNFNVYPNPADNAFFISMNNSNETTFKITDVLGKVVVDEKFIGTKKLDTSNFKNGVYVVTIQNNGQHLSKRIVIKH